MLTSSEIALHTKRSEHRQYDPFPAVWGTCKLFLELLSYACINSSQAQPQPSLFQTPQGEGKGPSPAAGSKMKPVLQNGSASHTQLTYGKGWIFCALSPLWSLVRILPFFRNLKSRIGLVPGWYLHIFWPWLTCVIVYPATQPNNLVKHQVPPEAKRGKEHILP